MAAIAVVQIYEIAYYFDKLILLFEETHCPHVVVELW